MSNPVTINQPAPDFELTDLNGKLFKLSEVNDHKNILLVFNRGFT
jgi:peroxiredoxin